MKPKIAFFISNLGRSIGGGHAYSMKTTISALSEEIDPVIVVIGLTKYRLFSQSEHKVYNIHFDGLNIPQVFDALRRVMKTERPGKLHAFDLHAYFFARFLHFRYKVGLILTKCGGPNPPYYFPKFHTVIVYSSENLEYFEKRRRFKNTTKLLVPNRVLQVQTDQQRVAKLRQYIATERGRTFIRIARIGKEYEQSILQAINLVNKLNQEGLKTTLIVIGVVYDQTIYNRMQSLNNENIIFVTDPDFTINSSELLSIADFVIGTGRGLMEAASLGKVMLTTVANSSFPVLVNESTFQALFETNFSPRNSLSQAVLGMAYAEIKEAVQNEDKLHALKEFSSQVFYKHFAISSKKEFYKDIYRHLKYVGRHSLLDFIIHALYTMRTFFLYSKRLRSKPEK